MPKCVIASVLVGIALVLGGVVLLVGKYPEKIIDSEINKQLAISLNSPEFDDWMTPPPPIYMQYWMFNVTNPDAVIAGQRANLTQIGPFTYRLYQPRYNVALYTNNTVSYQYNHTLVFVKNMSCADPHNVTITNLNVPLLTIAGMLKNMHIPAFISKKIIEIFKDSKVFPQHTAYELLFGYNDSLLSFAHMFIPSFPAKFGLFYGFNNTDDGVYLVNSGRKDISLVNKMEKWNFKSELDYWSDKYGNMLNGTDGVFFHPDMKITETIYAYSTDICRSLPFKYEMNTDVRSISTYRYHTTAMAFANSTVNPDNGAFCVPAGNCMGSGVLNISVCKDNAPVVISSPHFYLGDPKYVNGVIGLKPNKTYHETYLDIEPTTGTVLRANKRLQLNIQLEASEYSDDLKNVRTTTFPFVWLNESVTVDVDSANHLKQVLMVKQVVLSTPYILFGISALIFVIIIIVTIHKNKKKGTPLLTNVDYDEDEN
ncbi:lysosome membrane protein 2-like [Styela clava]